MFGVTEKSSQWDGPLAMRALRWMVIMTLVLLTVQGWTGDFANLFAVFPSGGVAASFGGFWAAVGSAGAIVAYHALEAAALLVCSVVILALSLRERVGRLFALLGMASVVSAAIGGVLFVLSGFQNNPNSAQMGGSFIGAYAFYFLTLYSTKQPASVPPAQAPHP